MASNASLGVSAARVALQRAKVVRVEGDEERRGCTFDLHEAKNAEEEGGVTLRLAADTADSAAAWVEHIERACAALSATHERPSLSFAPSPVTGRNSDVQAKRKSRISLRFRSKATNDLVVAPRSTGSFSFVIPGTPEHSRPCFCDGHLSLLNM